MKYKKVFVSFLLLLINLVHGFAVNRMQGNKGLKGICSITKIWNVYHYYEFDLCVDIEQFCRIDTIYRTRYIVANYNNIYDKYINKQCVFDKFNLYTINDKYLDNNNSELKENCYSDTTKIELTKSQMDDLYSLAVKLCNNIPKRNTSKYQAPPPPSGGCDGITLTLDLGWWGNRYEIHVRHDKNYQKMEEYLEGLTNPTSNTI